MLIPILAVPVLFLVAAVHRYLQLYAPSNRLVRRVRTSPPRWSTTAFLVVLAVVLLMSMHVLAEAVAAGAPGWLNLIVLIFAWDALKIGVLAGAVAVRLCRPRPAAVPPGPAR